MDVAFGRLWAKQPQRMKGLGTAGATHGMAIANTVATRTTYCCSFWALKPRQNYWPKNPQQNSKKKNLILYGFGAQKSFVVILLFFWAYNKIIPNVGPEFPNLGPKFGNLGPKLAQNFVVDPKKQQNYKKNKFGPKTL